MDVCVGAGWICTGAGWMGTEMDTYMDGWMDGWVSGGGHGCSGPSHREFWLFPQQGTPSRLPTAIHSLCLENFLGHFLSPTHSSDLSSNVTSSERPSDYSS